MPDNSAASFPDPKLLRLRTDELSSVSNSVGDPQGLLLFPLCDLDNPPPPEAAAFAGFDVAASMSGGAERPSVVWDKVHSAAKPPKPPPERAPQQAGSATIVLPRPSFDAPAPLQQPLWLATLSAPKNFRNSSPTAPASPLAPAAGPPSSDPNVPVSAQSRQQLAPLPAIPRWEQEWWGHAETGERMGDVAACEARGVARSPHARWPGPLGLGERACCH